MFTLQRHIFSIPKVYLFGFDLPNSIGEMDDFQKRLPKIWPQDHEATHTRVAKIQETEEKSRTSETPIDPSIQIDQVQSWLRITWINLSTWNDNTHLGHQVTGDDQRKTFSIDGAVKINDNSDVYTVEAWLTHYIDWAIVPRDASWKVPFHKINSLWAKHIDQLSLWVKKQLFEIIPSTNDGYIHMDLWWGIQAISDLWWKHIQTEWHNMRWTYTNNSQPEWVYGWTPDIRGSIDTKKYLNPDTADMIRTYLRGGIEAVIPLSERYGVTHIAAKAGVWVDVWRANLEASVNTTYERGGMASSVMRGSYADGGVQRYTALSATIPIPQTWGSLFSEVTRPIGNSVWASGQRNEPTFRAWMKWSF
jgi:hypothetical protein